MVVAAPQRQLERGNRMVELLKQPQFSPMTVGHQVITILAGSSGLLDDIPVLHKTWIQRTQVVGK